MRLCSDLGLDSDLGLGEVGVTEIGIPTTILILIYVMSIIIWGLGRKRRLIVARRHHIGFVCRAQFLVWVVRVVRVLILVLVLLWALVRRWLAGCRRVCCLTDTHPFPSNEKPCADDLPTPRFPCRALSLYSLCFITHCVYMCTYVYQLSFWAGVIAYRIFYSFHHRFWIMMCIYKLYARPTTLYHHPLQHQSSR
jgi:hypothetical protein